MRRPTPRRGRRQVLVGGAAPQQPTLRANPIQGQLLTTISAGVFGSFITGGSFTPPPSGEVSPLSLSTFLMPDTATTGTPLITLTGGVSGAIVNLEDDLVAAQAGALQVSGNVIQAGSNFAALRHGTYRLGIRMTAGSTVRYYETFVTKYAAGAANATCTTEGDLNTALAAATTAGGSAPYVIDLNPATSWASLRSFATSIPATSHRVIIRTSGNPLDMSGDVARIDRASLTNSRAIMFQNVEFVSFGIPGRTDSTGFSGNLQAAACVNLNSNANNENIEFFRCRIAGGFNEDKLAPLNPDIQIDPASNNYPGYAGFACNYGSNAKVGAIGTPTVPAGISIWPSMVNIPLDNTSVRNLVFNADPALNEQVYIGNNTPDGALSSNNAGWPATGGYSMIFRQQSGWAGTLAAGRFRVESGWITGFIMDNWGAGYSSDTPSGTHHPALTVGWPERLTMWNRLVNGITNLDNISGLKVTECVVENLLNGIGSTCPQQEQIVATTIRNIYADFMARFANGTKQVEKESIFAFNVMYGHFGASLDNPNVHGDFFQTRTVIDGSFQRMHIIGNLCDVGNARGGVQGMFMSDNFTLPQVVGVPSNSWFEGTIAGNVSRSSLTNGFAIVTGRDVLAWRNLFIGHPTRGSSSGASGYSSGGSVFSALINSRAVPQGQIVMIDNVANTASISINPLITSANYQLLGNVSNYVAAFAGGTSPTTLTTPAAFKAALTPIGALASSGAGVWLAADTDPVFNHEGRNWQPERVPIRSPMGKRTGVARSTQILSPVRRVWRGNKNTGLSISVSAGAQWRSANDLAMTSIIQDWTSSPGNVAYGKYYQKRHTSSASFYALTTTTLTLDGQNSNFQTLTEDVDNGGPVAPGGTSARTGTGTTLGAANVYAKHVLLAIKFKTPVSSATTCRLFTFGNNRTSITINNLGACTLAINAQVLNLGAVIKFDTEHTLVIKVNRQIASPAVNPDDNTRYNVYPESVVVVLDGVDVTPKPEPGTLDPLRAGNGTTGTNGVAWNSGSLIDGTGAADNFLVFAAGSALIADRVSLFSDAATTPGNVCPAGWKLHWLALDWETADTPFPDILSDDIITKFSNDRIIAAQAGDVTQWPLGRPFKVFYQPTPAQMNASPPTVSNKGTVVLLNSGADVDHPGGGRLSNKFGAGTFT